MQGGISRAVLATTDLGVTRLRVKRPCAPQSSQIATSAEWERLKAWVMDQDHKKAAEVARQYFGTTDPLTRLGWGISGQVFLSPDLRTAVKVHHRAESFTRELEVYRELRRLKLSRLHGLTIPKLRGYRLDLKLIRMDFVSSPYLLDFAGVQYEPPDFPADTMERWHAQIADVYGPNASIAYDVYQSLSQHGLYYMDFRPSNMKLDGLPGLLPFPTDPEEEKW